MHFTIDRKALIKAIDFVSATVAVRTTRPAIEGIKISVVRKNEANLAVLESTDLEISSQYTLPTNALLPATEGACCVDPKQLVQILRTRENEAVELKLTDRGLNVVTAGMDVDLQTRPVDEFPPAVDLQEVSKLQLDAKAFADALKSVFCAEDKGETGGRWATSGVYLEENGDAIEIVATDARRLAWSHMKTPCGVSPNQGGVIVPRKAAHLIERMLRASGGEQAEMIVGKTEVKVTAGDTVISSRLMEGKFPPYKQIYPKVSANSIKLDLAQLKRDMRAVAAVKHPDNGSRATWAFEPGKMLISGTGVGSVSITNDVDCSFKVSTSLDADMLCGLIDARDGEATIHISNSKQPVLIEQDGWKSLIMPLCD
mgnify:CR=1 FL=1